MTNCSRKSTQRRRRMPDIRSDHPERRDLYDAIVSAEGVVIDLGKDEEAADVDGVDGEGLTGC